MPQESLYNFYRPRRFDELFGQPELSTIGRSIAQGTFAQGYLLSGPHGCGKTSTARIIASALNCPNIDEGGNPCLECDSCLKAMSRSYADIVEFNASIYNTRADVDNLISTIYNPPLMGDYKIYIIDEVQRLSREAESLLLKPLEEPPSNVVFILCTTAPDKVAPTIKSRIVSAHATTLSHDDALRFLHHIIAWGREDFPTGHWDISDDDLHALILRVGGNPRDLLTGLHTLVFHEHPDDADEKKDSVRALTQLIVSGDDMGVMSFFLGDGYSLDHTDTVHSVVENVVRFCHQNHVHPSGLSQHLWDGEKRIMGDQSVSPLWAMSFCAMLAKLFADNQQ